jgi:hypothetical protein
VRRVPTGELELRVEGRDFQNADIGHVEHVGDVLDRGFRDPAILLLRAHQQRNDADCCGPSDICLIVLPWPRPAFSALKAKLRLAGRHHRRDDVRTFTPYQSLYLSARAAYLRSSSERHEIMNPRFADETHEVLSLFGNGSQKAHTTE